MSSHPNYTWGTRVLITGGPVSWFSFGHWGNFLCAHWSPWSTFPPVYYHNGTVWLRQKLLFQLSLSCNWDSVLFSDKFLIRPDFPSPLLGKDILIKVQASVFMNMKPSLSLPLLKQTAYPRVWADGETGSNTKCCSCHYQAPRHSLISTSKAVSTKAWS